MEFGEKIISNTLFSLLDLLITKIGTTVAFILLVRFLPAHDIATIGIGMGYLVFVFYLEIGPIRVLLRDYPKIKKNINDRDELLSALFLFWCLQAVSMLLLYFGLRFFVFSRLNFPDLSFLFLGMVVDIIALSFQDWIKIIFYSDLRQAIATRVGIFLNIIRIACYGMLYFYPSLDNFSLILIVTSFVNCIVWAFVFQRWFGYRPIINRRIPGIIKQSLGSYGLWDHLNRMSVDTLFTIDTVVLSWIAFVRIQDIGNYTVALKFTSLLFLIPMQLARSLQLLLSNYSDDKKRFDSINSLFKLNFLVSIVQLLFVIIAGKWLIHLMFGQNIHPDVIQYTFVISIAVTVMNLGFPMTGIINTFCNLRQAFIYVFFPALVAGICIYYGAAFRWGAIGIAYGNILNYTILTIGLSFFAYKKYPFPVRYQLITSDEIGFLRAFIRGRSL